LPITASQQQILANRRNAEKSTGPRSADGKARSRHNALTHGLTAEHVVLPDEDADDFEALREAFVISLAPEDALQDQLVERAASLVWRLRRVPAFEVALFNWMTYVQTKDNDGMGCSFKSRSLLADAFAPTDDGSDASEEDLEVGRTIEAMLNTNLTGKLSRYETGLQRQLSATLAELRELKATRPDRSTLIDVADEN